MSGTNFYDLPLETLFRSFIWGKATQALSLSFSKAFSKQLFYCSLNESTLGFIFDFPHLLWCPFLNQFNPSFYAISCFIIFVFQTKHLLRIVHPWPLIQFALYFILYAVFLRWIFSLKLNSTLSHLLNPFIVNYHLIIILLNKCQICYNIYTDIFKCFIKRRVRVTC